MITKASCICWGLDISEEQALQIEKTIDPKISFVLLSEEEFFSAIASGKSIPLLFFVSLEVEKKLQKDIARDRNISFIPRVLVLPANHELTEANEAIDTGAFDIIRFPLTKKKIKHVIKKAREFEDIHHDIQYMTREIMLEREILERKNDVLSFLVTFLTSITTSMNTKHILKMVFTSINILFSIKSLHLVMWNKNKFHEDVLSIFINEKENSHKFDKYKSILIDEASKYCVINSSAAIEYKEININQEKKGPYKTGENIVLPLFIDTKPCGVIVLETNTNQNLGRDQVEALDIALKHLALTLINAEQYELAKVNSERDALTSLYNRRHFEQKLDEEISRALRYAQSLSMLTLDIDHFKNINDLYGHSAGDSVLRELAVIIQNVLRNTDYCARVGGEEFCILLPSTERKQAYIVAERLRKRIAGYSFALEDRTIHATVSIGLSHVNIDCVLDNDGLTQEADKALYIAKANGRNCCYASIIKEPSRVVNS